MRHIANIKLTLLFIFCIFTYLSAQDIEYTTPNEPGTRYSREETRQHYLQGKEFYSQGRYTEARNEFEKALDSVKPPTIGITEKAPQVPETTLIPKVSLPKTKEKLTKDEKEKKKEEEAGVSKTIAVPQPMLETEVTEERQYYLDLGDVLDVSVWQVPDLSRGEVIVRPDGKISFPLIGDIKVEGLTLTQLDSIITEKLKAYLKAPEVSVMIRKFGGQANKVVILGEISGPGVYRFGSPPTITEAIASAGGYTKYAVLNSILVISGDVRTKPTVTRVNVAQILKSGNLSENIFLKSNDIVVVPRSFIGKLNVFMELIQPAISEYMQYMDARHFHNVMQRYKGQ